MKKHIGSSFESFLKNRGIKEEVELQAQKELRARSRASHATKHDQGALKAPARNAE
jgi:hypothetical protein